MAQDAISLERPKWLKSDYADYAAPLQRYISLKSGGTERLIAQILNGIDGVYAAW